MIAETKGQTQLDDGHPPGPAPRRPGLLERIEAFRAKGRAARAEARLPSGGRGHRIEMSGSVGCLEIVGPAPDRDGQRKARWACRCTRCGAEVTKSGTELRRGVYARCGARCGKLATATAVAADRPRTAKAAAAVEPDWGEAERIAKQRMPGDGPEAAAETGKPGLGTIVAGYLAEWRAGRNPLAPGGRTMGGGGGEDGGE